MHNTAKAEYIEYFNHHIALEKFNFEADVAKAITACEKI